MLRIKTKMVAIIIVENTYLSVGTVVLTFDEIRICYF